MVDQNVALDLSGIESAVAWLRARRNFLLGLLLVAVVAIVGAQFIRARIHAAQVRPWAELIAAKEPWQETPDELANARQRVEKTPAEPYALYWESLQRFEKMDTNGAIVNMESMKSTFPTHVLCTTKLLDPEHPHETRAPVDRLLGSMQRMQQWHTLYPAPTSNPPPKPLYLVSLITERGTIQLALYNDVALHSCEAFLKVAPQLKDSYIAKAIADQWIEIGQDQEGNPITASDVSSEFPPYEPDSIKTLYHFAGTVSFRQPPFEKGSAHPDLHVMLKNDFDQDGRSTVFAMVVQGQDLLATIAKEPVASGKRVLATPVKISEVKIDPVAPTPDK